MFAKQPILVFTGLLVLALLAGLLVHIGVLTYFLFPFTLNDLTLPYIVNFILALVITVTLYLLREKQANSLGFIFMASSFLKFLVFVLVFTPLYQEDGVLSPIEFGWFFVPYAIALIIETSFLVKILNQMD